MIIKKCIKKECIIGLYDKKCIHIHTLSDEIII